MKIIDWKFSCKAKKTDCMSVVQQLSIVNNSSVPIEFSLPIAIGALSDAKSITVRYKNITKKAKIAQLSKSDLIQFDNEVSCGNLVVSVYQDENSIEISNLPHYSIIDVSVRMSAYLVNDLYNLYFVIPPIDKYDKNLYPNYKISIQTLTEKIILKDIKLEYNEKDHTKEIKDKTNIEVDDVSFQSSLILKMPLKKIEHQHFNSLLKVSDIIIFIDSSFSISSSLSSSVINFLNNYGINYRFSIIKYGSNSCALFNKMIEKNQETIDEAEKFISVRSSTDLYCDFIDAYTNIFGLGYNGPILKSEQEKIKHQALHIEEINIDNTIAICFGTFNGNGIITTRKVPTFIIDPILKHDSINFAFRNDFEFIGPFFHNKYEIEFAFNNLMQKIRTYTNESRNQYFEEEPIYTENIDNSQTKSNQDESESNFRILLQDLKKLESNIAKNEKASSSHKCPSSESPEIQNESSPNKSNNKIEDNYKDNNNNSKDNYNNNKDDNSNSKDNNGNSKDNNGNSKDNNNNNKDDNNSNDKDNNNNNKDNNNNNEDIIETHIMKGKVVACSPIKNQNSFLSFPIDDVDSSDLTYVTPLNLNSIFSDEYLSNLISYQYDNDVSTKVSLEEKKKIEKENYQLAVHEQDSEQIKFSNIQEKLEKETKKDYKENESKKTNNENEKKDIESKNNNNENEKKDFEVKEECFESKKKDFEVKEECFESKKKDAKNNKENNKLIKTFHLPQVEKILQLPVQNKFDVHDNNIGLIQAKFINSDMPELNREFAGNDLSTRI